MNEQDNVIYLKDFIAQKKNISFKNDLKPNMSLYDPSSELVKRIFSFVVDIFVISFIFLSLFSSYAIFINDFMAPLIPSLKNHLLNMNTWLFAGVFMTVYYSYFLFCSFVLEGKTVGKMVFALRVINDHFIHDVDEKNYKLTLSQAAKRAFGYLTCYLTFGIFFIFNFASEDKRGLADYISSSRTVSDRWLKEMIEYKLHQREQLSIEISSLSVSA